MTKSEFSSLKGQLVSGNNQSLTTIFERHSRYCIQILIAKYGCNRDDAEDIYVDAILNFREKVVGDQIEVLTDVRAYLLGTCRNMFLVRLKKDERTNRAIREAQLTADMFHEPFDSSQAAYRDGLRQVVETALATIPDKCRNILKAFYFEQADLNDIAARMGFASANVAKVIKARCFKKLITEVKCLTHANKVNYAAERR